MNEVCKGCGAEATPTQAIVENQIVDRPGQHPWVAVMSSDAASLDPSKFHDVPVCDACHRQPVHRTADPLKAHFFPRAQRKLAVFAAQTQIMLDT